MANENNYVTVPSPSALSPIQKTYTTRPLNNLKPIGENITKPFRSLTSSPIPVAQKTNTNISLVEKLKVIYNIVLPPSIEISIVTASSSVDSISKIIPETEISLTNKQTGSNKKPVGTKRVRLISVDSENEEAERPKRKCRERTAAEEEEYVTWAAQLNAICEEVDKHNLEIV